MYLFLGTGDAKYGDFVRDNYRKLRPFHDDRWSVYHASQGDALLYYAASKQADPALKKEIQDKKRAEGYHQEFYRFLPDRDLYRAYMRRDFAHAALVYGEFEAHKAFAADLRQRSISAFDHYQQNPKSDQCDDTTVKSGDADQPLPEQDQEAVVGAVYLFLGTGDAKYGRFGRDN